MDNIMGTLYNILNFVVTKFVIKSVKEEWRMLKELKRKLT